MLHRVVWKFEMGVMRTDGDHWTNERHNLCRALYLPPVRDHHTSPCLYSSLSLDRPRDTRDGQAASLLFLAVHRLCPILIRRFLYSSVRIHRHPESSQLCDSRYPFLHFDLHRHPAGDVVESVSGVPFEGGLQWRYFVRSIGGPAPGTVQYLA